MAAEAQEEEDLSNLIVNYVPQAVNEDELRDLFSPFGQVESCKLIMDWATGRSQGYGFVKFVNAEDAAKAIEVMNGYNLGAKTLKVSIARKSSPAIKGANLYVCGLPTSFSEIEFTGIFSPFGEIIDSKLLIEPTTGISRGVGFVRYSTRDSAESAIAALNGQRLQNSSVNLQVKFANSSEHRHSYMQRQGGGPGWGPPPMHRFYHEGRAGVVMATPMGGLPPMGGMPGSMTSAIAPPMAPLRYEPVHIPMRGYPSLGPGTIGGLSFTPAPMPPPQTYCLFVYHLPPDSTESTLYQLFGPYGAVTQVKVMKDLNTGAGKGYGFVNMLNEADAKAAILGLNGFKLGSKYLQVSFKTGKGSKSSS